MITKIGKKAGLAGVIGAAAMTSLPAMAADAAPPAIDTGDTAWMLVSTALVLMMTIPGLGLFYAGMVRKKNVLATLMQSFAICCIMTVVWMMLGYSLAFTSGNAFIGGLSRVMLNGLGAGISKGSDVAFTMRRARPLPRP